MKEAASMVDLDPAQLDAELAAASRPLLLDLWAPWCGPCLMMAPTLQTLAATTQQALTVARLDVERHPGIGQRHGVRSIPCLILFKNGKEVSRRSGLHSREQLARWLADEGVALSFSGAQAPAARDAPHQRSFHGDPALRAELVQRVQRMADAGQLVASRLPLWREGAATLSAALAGSAQPEAFERVTGMPYALACALELTSSCSPDDVAPLLAALPVGADLHLVAVQLLRRWLDDEALPWTGVLDDGAADTLRRDWTATCESALSGTAVAPEAWASLRTGGERLVSPEPRCTVPSHFGPMIALLSPPPLDDAAAWVSGLLVYGRYLKSALARYRLGWRRDDFGVETLRHAWLAAHAPAPETLSDEELQAWRDRYRAQHADIEDRYEPLAAQFYARHQQHLQPINERLRAQLLQLLQACNPHPLTGPSSAQRASG